MNEGQSPYQVFENQVGGHSLFLKTNGSKYVMKPANENELNFYQMVYKQSAENFKSLIQFIPLYYGTLQLQTDQSTYINLELQKKVIWIEQLVKKSKQDKNALYIQLEDLTDGFDSPCILDLKMGFKPFHQKDEMKYQHSTSSQIGFRICGMNINQPKYQLFKDKYWGRNLSGSNLNQQLAKYFFDSMTNTINIDLLYRFIDQLKKLTEIILENKQFRWTSCSLLLIYDGNHSERYQLKLIDFANVEQVLDSKEPDECMINAISNLVRTLMEISAIENLCVEDLV